jgi:carbamoyltransferase
MQLAVPVRSEEKEQVRATLHVDGTTRPQVCFAEDNPRYHALLTAFGRRFGCSVLLNTSFNPSGYPLVASPEEALVMFARTDMDALVVNQTVISKTRSAEA